MAEAPAGGAERASSRRLAVPERHRSWHTGWDAPRLAIATVFLLDGVTFGAWVAHLPLLKRGVGLSDLRFSLVLAGLVGGAFVAQPLAGVVATRVGSRRVTRIAAVAAALALALPPFATSLFILAAAAALLGLTRGFTEVPMNAQAALLEARHARPRMSSFHACFSLGGFLGSAVAAVLLRAGLAARTTLAAIGVVAALVAALAGRSLLDDAPYAERAIADAPPSDEPPTLPHAPSLGVVARDGVLLALGVLAFCGLFGEGAMADWSALLLERTTGVPPAAAALGYAAFSVAMTAGRVGGDIAIASVGRRRMLRASGVLAAAGLVVAVLAPYGAALVGFAIVGLGYANLVPILFSASGRRAGSAGVAAVSTIGYAGLVVGPPVIGALSHLFSSLPAALGIVGLFALAIAVGSRAVDGAATDEVAVTPP